MTGKKAVFALLAAAVCLGAAGYGLFRIPLALAESQPEQKDSKAASAQDRIRMEMAQDLKKKQEEQDRREEQLKAKEGQLKTLETEIEKKIEELRAIQLKVEELIKMRNDLEDKNVASLSKAYAAMSPADAAVRLKTMDRGIALRILLLMKTKESSKILANLDTQTAAQISEQLAKRQME